MKLSKAEAMLAVAKYQELRDSATDILDHRLYHFLAAWAAWHVARCDLVAANQSGSAGLRGAAMRHINSVAQRMARSYVALKTTQSVIHQNARVPVARHLIH